MSVASAVYERTCHVCDAVRLYFQRAISQMQRGRQLSANQRIMNEVHIWNRGDKDLMFHLQQMNEATNREFDKKIEELR